MAGRCVLASIVKRQDLIRTKIGLPAFEVKPAMKLSTQIKPISYLKSHTAQIVKELAESRQPMVITQNGEATLVVIDVKVLKSGRTCWHCSRSWPWVTRRLSEASSGTWRPFADLDKADLQ
jgi:hypothetical protein